MILNINMEKKSELIEQYYSGNLSFGKKACHEICRNGRGIDQMFLHFVLPELPLGVHYKPFIVYDLIKLISIEIGGSQIIEMNSKQLNVFDQTERELQRIKGVSPIVDNKVIYPIDLNMFFGKTKCDEDVKHVLDLDFEGIRMTDLGYNIARFYVTLNNIDKIIVNYETLDLGCQTALSKLELVDATIWSNYVNFNPELPNKPTIKLEQQITKWHHENDLRKDGNETKTFKVKLDQRQGTTTKIIIKSDIIDKMDKILLQLNGRDYMDRMDVKTYKRIYEYNHKVTLPHDILIYDAIIPPQTNTMLCVWLTEPFEEFSIDFMTNEIVNGTYYNGMFGILQE